MGAILLVLAARARRYWRSWLLLGLVAAIGTGIVLAAVTAGRRADSAFLDAGVVAVPVLPGWLIAAFAAGVLVGPMAIAVVPAAAAARSPAGAVLHTE